MSKHVAFTFGRMNPPTIGHEKLVDKVRSVARMVKATPMVFLSHTADRKKNPLDYNTKLRYIKKAFGPIVQKSKANTIIKIMQELEKKFDAVTLVVGSDRVQDFTNLLSKYNGRDYTFEEINVVSAGQRDPDAEGAEGASGTKMRELATSGDLETYKSFSPNRLSDKDKESMYNSVRKGLKITEENILYVIKHLEK